MAAAEARTDLLARRPMTAAAVAWPVVSIRNGRWPLTACPAHAAFTSAASSPGPRSRSLTTKCFPGYHVQGAAAGR